MKFSRVQLRGDAPRHEVVHALRGGYAVHQLVWDWFSEDDARRFLMRQEHHSRGTTFYVLSERAPCVDPRIWEAQTKEFQPQLAAGDVLQFSLRANPTVSVPKGRGERGQRHDVVMHALKSDDSLQREEATQRAGIQWLEARSERNGFSLIDGSVRVENYQQHRLLKKGRAPIRFSTIDLDGALQVRDPEAFRTVLERGLGRAKSFGCGLMLVRRA